jgi:phage regulator Rha-like protein
MQLIQKIENTIYEIRGQKVMLDYDLAQLYEVETRVMNQAVKRNIVRFPEDFMFSLTLLEWETLKSQIVVSLEKANSNSSQIVMSSKKNRGKTYLPYAFTEHGVTMLASVLRSEKAVQMNIAIVRAFIAIRHYIAIAPNLNDKLNDLRHELKTRIDEHDTQLNAIYDTLENLLDKKQEEQEQQGKWENRKRIGFKTGKK